MTSKDASSQDMRELAAELRDRAHSTWNAIGHLGEGSLQDLLDWKAAAVIEAALSTTPDIGEPPLRGLKEEITLAKQIMVARAIFRSGFHPSDVASGAADKKWDEWDEDRTRAFKQAGAALLALQAAEGCGSPTLHPDTKSKIDDELTGSFAK